MSDGMYLIWTHEHGMWWKPERMGYTTEVEEAGRYSFITVAEIVIDHIPAGEEVAVREQDAVEKGRGAVFGLPDEKVETPT